MGIQRHFIKFHDAIKLGRQDDAYAKARVKDTSITDEIKKKFKDAGYPVIDDFIQGSFSTDTAILKKDGDFDIDRAIVINSDEAPENPVDPKKVVLNILEQRGFKNAKIKKPCVTADYSSENLHIDFPIYKEKNGFYELAVGKKGSDEDNREWSSSDPKALKSWIKDNSSYGSSRSAKQQQYNRLVRYIKRWRDEQFGENIGKKVYSIGLTVMFKLHFSWNLDDDANLNDLCSLRDTVDAVLRSGLFTYQGDDQYKVEVILPVVPYRDIFYGSSKDTGTQLHNKLHTLRIKLDEVIAETDEVKQCKILNKLFGDDFIVPEQGSSADRMKRAVYATAGAVGTSQGA